MYLEYDPIEIKKLIRTKGLSTHDVAKRSSGKLSQPTVSRLASGKLKSAEQSKLQALASALSVPLEQLKREGSDV